MDKSEMVYFDSLRDNQNKMQELYSDRKKEISKLFTSLHRIILKSYMEGVKQSQFIISYETAYYFKFHISRNADCQQVFSRDLHHINEDGIVGQYDIDCADRLIDGLKESIEQAKKAINANRKAMKQ